MLSLAKNIEFVVVSFFVSQADQPLIVFELLKINEDPQGVDSIIGQHPKLVKGMKLRDTQWYEDANSSRPRKLQRMYISTSHENSVSLTRQSWMGAALKEHASDYSDVDIKWPGKYKAEGQIADPINKNHEAYFRVRNTVHERAMPYCENRCIC